MTYGTGAVLVALAGLLWSLNGLAIRGIEEAGTWAVLFWRSVGLVPVLFAFIAWRSGGRPLRAVRDTGVPGAVGGMGLVLAFAGAIFAIQSTTVANAVFLFAASPVLTACLGWLLLRERVRPATWGAIALAGAGVFLMVHGGLEGGAMAGNIAALLSATGFAAFTIMLRLGRVADMMPAVLLGGIFSILAAGAVMAIMGEPLLVPLRDMLIALGMGAVLLGLGMVLYTLGSRVLPAADLTLLSMVEVLLAPLWVFLVLGETASRDTFLGGAIILAAVAGNALSGLRRQAPETS